MISDGFDSTIGSGAGAQNRTHCIYFGKSGTRRQLNKYCHRQLCIYFPLTGDELNNAP